MAYISKKTTANGVKPIGSNLFGTCSTASGTAQKDVTMADFDVLVSGVTIHVYFTHKNTATNPTLKVGSTSAVAIKRNGASDGKWKDGSVVSFTYDGTNWVQNDADDDGVTYSFSVSGHTLNITGSDGSTQALTLPDDDTTYTLSGDGRTIFLIDSDGSSSSTEIIFESDLYVAGLSTTLDEICQAWNKQKVIFFGYEDPPDVPLTYVPLSELECGNYATFVETKKTDNGAVMVIHRLDYEGQWTHEEVPFTSDNVFYANFLTTLEEICDAVNDGKQVWLKQEIPLPPSQSRIVYQYTPLAELDCSSHAMFYDIDHFDETDITQITVWTVDDTNGWTHKYIPIWQLNTASDDGYVTKGEGQSNKVWKTDENGNPDWRDESGNDHIELTQAEYDALTQEEKNNGSVYFITDGIPKTMIVNDSVPIGAIQSYAGASAPSGWLICDGSAVSRTTYSELFEAIGTRYGSGDGSTTFNVPDLRGKVTIGVSGSHALASSGGEETHKLVLSETPSHTHNVTANFSMRGTDYNDSAMLWGGTGTTTAKTTDTGNKADTVHQVNGAQQLWRLNLNRDTTSKGSDGSHNNMQPFLTVNAIIKAKDHTLVQADAVALLDKFYPVGAYLETSDADYDPNADIGGTWSRVTVQTQQIKQVTKEINKTPNASASTNGYMTYLQVQATWGISADAIQSIQMQNYSSSWRILNFYRYGGDWVVVSNANTAITGSVIIYYMEVVDTCYRWHRTA